MPLFSKNEKKVFFIHIPRTSGRYVTELFKCNNFDLKFHETSMKDLVCDLLPAHFHYPLYNRYFGVRDCSHFSIVRDPVNKIWSSLKIYYLMYKPPNYFKNLENKNWFNDFIDFQRSHESYHNNWFSPQFSFISEKTKIYRYEAGMNENFIFWVNDNFSLDLIDKKVKYKKLNEEKIVYDFTLTKNLANNIKEYYYEDYKKFYG